MNQIREIDFGTPEVSQIATTELTIDGITVTVPEGTSVMRAAMLAGVQVPKLCATDSLEAFGSCRLCLVEIAGRKGTVTVDRDEHPRGDTTLDGLAKLRAPYLSDRYPDTGADSRKPTVMGSM